MPFPATKTFINPYCNYCIVTKVTGGSDTMYKMGDVPKDDLGGLDVNCFYVIRGAHTDRTIMFRPNEDFRQELLNGKLSVEIFEMGEDGQPVAIYRGNEVRGRLGEDDQPAVECGAGPSGEIEKYMKMIIGQLPIGDFGKQHVLKGMSLDRGMQY